MAQKIRYSVNKAHAEFEVVSINSLPEHNIAGMYSWFLNLPNSRGAIPGKKVPDETDNGQLLRQYGSLFLGKDLRAEFSGNLRERYRGLVSRESLFVTSDTRGRYEEISADSLNRFSTAFCVFSVPLYIGISTQIRDRLKTHQEQFVYAYDEALRKKEIRDEVGIDDLCEADSELESRAFGQRLAALMIDSAYQQRHCLFAKVVYFPGATKSQLEEVEFVANRLFTPLLGRR